MDKDLDRILRDREAFVRAGRVNTSGALSPAGDVRFLDTGNLAVMEESFRHWADEAVRSDVRLSRKRITLIFLLIRYTGARLGEILSLDETRAFDLKRLTVTLGETDDENEGDPKNKSCRSVEIPQSLASELEIAFSLTSGKDQKGSFFGLDPAHVRRKFYERAEACGLPRDYGNPSSIRRSRAIELIRNNIPIPMVQKILGHSTSSLTSSYIDFSKDDLKKVLRNYVDRESRRKTSARNSFFGAVSRIKRGDIQSEIEIVTISGNRITSVITNESLERLMLTEDSLVTAEIKAPWVLVARDSTEPMSSAANRLKGKVARIIKGSITTEVVSELEDGTEVCALVTEESRVNLDLREESEVWLLFSAFSVIINAD